ncbi:unnamed protein product [Rotaria sordida]|uniref:Uncharacterized protein n=1 Tax=Rotaria sordida TaxID=392033 RepID=A0A815T433_9BILA|nr:unnamed protein product [Rotaria sordida]CAF1499459.1 unnamed protein product [Rotaria sordida]
MTSNVLPTQTNVINESRLGRPRPHNYQHYHESKIKTQPNAVIHVNIRLPNDKFTNRHEDLHWTSASNDKMHYYQDDAQKSRNNRISQQSSGNTLDSNYQED